MKRILILLSIWNSFLYASSSESKIIKVLFSSLFNTQNIRVYANDPNKIKVLEESGFKNTTNCKEADVIYGKTMPKECLDKPLFTDSYKVLLTKENAIGAFYWKKGRANILILKSRVEKLKLVIPASLEKYMMERL